MSETRDAKEVELRALKDLGSVEHDASLADRGFHDGNAATLLMCAEDLALPDERVGTAEVIGLAYSDVARAFDQFLAGKNRGEPVTYAAYS